MANITEREFKASYELGIEVYKKKISIEDAIAEAVESGIDEGYARSNIQFLISMMRGEVYKRSINQTCLRYYCKNVLRDFGVEKLKIFLKGLELHIKYLKNIGSNVPGFCAIHTEYRKRAGMSPIF